MTHIIKEYRNAVSLECADIYRGFADSRKKACSLIYNIQTLEGYKEREAEFMVYSISIDDPAIRSYQVDRVDFDSVVFEPNTMCVVTEILSKRERVERSKRRILECYLEGED